MTASTALRPTNRRLQIMALVGLGGLAALMALPSDSPSLAFTPIAPSLEAVTTLPTLRLPVSLPTGTQIAPPSGSGYSQLTVKNGNPVDAVFKLVDRASGKTLRFVYVRANEDITLDDLGTCTCDLRFATGIDWDADQQMFRRSMALSAFSDPTEFAVKREGNMEYWTTVEVTLHPVEGGNAQTEALDASEF
ncbi:hypothetical protein PGN35_008740 [Nodosilinea sp. PGN35]|uniref:hypothetical protein n=1 Tax=Nodosilinea sp. PGN35 TaxID=3020489 RepID=UPI0023B343AD|nr:hypothetical protein [Nodosilinea sp. TSF1-S3]MDF0367933.1 hypothetical protein [Nodosilinea sp. TSF1-S3]